MGVENLSPHMNIRKPNIEMFVEKEIITMVMVVAMISTIALIVMALVVEEGEVLIATMIALIVMGNGMEEVVEATMIALIVMALVVMEEGEVVLLTKMYKNHIQ